MSFCCFKSLCERRKNRIIRMIKEAIKNNNHAAFQTIIRKQRAAIKEHVPEILQSVVRKRRREFLESLDTFGYLPSSSSETIQYGELGWYPLHDAIRTDNAEWVQILCDHKVFGNISKIPPLFCALEWGKRKGGTNIETDVKILEILINSGEDINNFYNNETPIYFAAKRGLWHCVAILLKYEAKIDTFFDYTTPRKLIGECQPYLLVNFALPDDKFYLIQALKLHKEDLFVSLLDKNPHLIDSEDDQGFTLLQRAIQNNLQKCAQRLLNLGADPNKAHLTAVCSKDDKINRSSPPIIMSIIRGQKSLFQNLINHKNINLLETYTKNNTIYHILARDWKYMTISSNIIQECVDKFFTEAFIKGVNILARNSKGHTAVGKACKTRDKILLGMFFKFGAFSSLNQFDLIKIQPEDLNEFFDQTIAPYLNQNKIRNHFEINYSFIDAPVVCDKRKKRVQQFNTQQRLSLDDLDRVDSVTYVDLNEKNDEHDCNNSYEEMDLFYLMSKSHAHVHILKHPIIRLFLYLKWKKICRFYFLNFIFYILFTIYLSLYVFKMGKHLKTPAENTEPFQFKGQIYICTFILWVVFILRELFQLILSWKTYLVDLENCLEITLMGTVGYLLMIGPHREIASIAVILTFIELTLLLDRYPFVSTYITIFIQVSRKTFGLLCIFTPVLFSFSYGFYIIFLNSNQIAFKNLGFSFMKSLSMLIGELQIEEEHFEVSSVTSRIILVFFVIFIVIVFSNVLSALAISDAQVIIDKAELISSIEEIRLYYKLEKIWMQYFNCGHGKLSKFLFIFQLLFKLIKLFKKNDIRFNDWFTMKVCPMVYCYTLGSHYRLYTNTPSSVSLLAGYMYKYIFGVDHIKISMKIIEILQNKNNQTSKQEDSTSNLFNISENIDSIDGEVLIEDNKIEFINKKLDKIMNELIEIKSYLSNVEGSS